MKQLDEEVMGRQIRNPEYAEWQDFFEERTQFLNRIAKALCRSETPGQKPEKANLLGDMG